MDRVIKRPISTFNGRSSFWSAHLWSSTKRQKLVVCFVWRCTSYRFRISLPTFFQPCDDFVHSVHICLLLLLSDGSSSTRSSRWRGGQTPGQFHSNFQLPLGSLTFLAAQRQRVDYSVNRMPTEPAAWFKFASTTQLATAKRPNNAASSGIVKPHRMTQSWCERSEVVVAEAFPFLLWNWVDRSGWFR